MRLRPLFGSLVVSLSLGAAWIVPGAREPFAVARAEASPAAPTSFQLPFTRFTLDNGLRVILHQDRSRPTVCVNLWYRVGPANEPVGRSGFAHLFEHLMFEGSKHAGRQFDYLLESVGGTNMNATTSWDRTNYYETVPAEHLELALWLEADRMGFMIDALTQERLDVQRDVVKNERRESYENQPYGPSALAIYQALYPAGHPFHGAVIGSIEDLSRATLDDAAAFFQRYYSPDNASLVLAGNFDEAVARRLIDKHFATLPKRTPSAPPGALPPAPKPVLPARVVVEEDVNLERVVLGWPSPPAFSGDEPALALSARMLAQGKASRLYQALVATSAANSVSAYLDTSQLGSVFFVEAVAAAGRTPAELEGVIDGKLVEFAESGPEPAELERAKTSFKLELASELQYLNVGGGEGGRAGWLQRLEHYLGDPGRLTDWVNAHERVTAAEIQRVVRQHLGASNRLVVVTAKRGAAQAANASEVTP